MTELSSENLHASCIAIDGRAVLIEGRSGSGKSDLALRLIDRGATLVADDRVVVQRRSAALTACAPDRIAGRIEVRGLGLVEMPFVSHVPVALVVATDGPVQRMAEPAARRRVAGVDLPALPVAAFEASAPIKVELALRALPGADR